MKKQLFLLGMVLISCTACSGAESRKTDYYQRGQKYFTEQNYDKARIELRNALQIDPKYVDARYLYGVVAEKRGDIREAFGQYQSVLDSDAKFEPARAALARIYMLGGMSDKSRELVDVGLKDDPKNAALLTVRGALEARQGHLPAALEDAEQANKLVPNDEYTISLLASLYKQSARLDKAVEVVSGAVKQLPKSADLRIVLADLKANQQDYAGVEQLLKEIIALDPQNVENRARLVRFYLSRKDQAAAEAAWRQAIVAVPARVEPKLALIDLLWSQRSEEAAQAEVQAQLKREPKNAELKLAIGNYLEQHDRATAAEQLYKEVIKQEDKEPKGLAARDQLAALALKRNDTKTAEALIAEVLKESQRDNDALILRANIALQRGDATTAITDLRSVLRDKPNSAPLMRALAKAHLQNNEAALAEETLRNALQTNPADVPTRKELAQLLLQQGKGDQAQTVLNQLASVQGNNVDLDVLDAQFKAQLMQKDYKAANESATKIQELRPKSAVGWYYAALVAEGQQQRDVARRNYEHALELQPDVAEPLAAITRLDVADKQSKRAIERLDKMIAQNPKHAVALNLRGEIWFADKQWQHAAESFSKAIEVAPQWAPPYDNLALAQLQLKQTDAALATYKNGFEKTKAEVLATKLATAYERLNKPEESISVYEQWVAQQPQSKLAVNNLTMLLLNYRATDKGSLARATQLADSLNGSNEPALLDTRGWVKYKNGDYQAAVNLLQQAANAHKDSPTIRYHLGMAQFRAGNANEARGNLQAAIATGQSFFGVDEAKSTLTQLDHPALGKS